MNNALTMSASPFITPQVATAGIIVAGFCICYITYMNATHGRDFELKYKDFTYHSYSFASASVTNKRA
jgi:hypothetical protein